MTEKQKIYFRETCKMRGWHEGLASYIWERDNGKCVYCGDIAVSIDHVVPFSRGGPTTKENGVCACRKCNGHKSGKLLLIYLTRAIYWLMSKGEDMTWIDKLQPTTPLKQRTRLKRC